MKAEIIGKFEIRDDNGSGEITVIWGKQKIRLSSYGDAIMITQPGMLIEPKSVYDSNSCTQLPAIIITNNSGR